MKFSSPLAVHLLVVVAAASVATAGAISKPSVSVSVANGDFDGVAEGLRPALRWSDSVTVGGGVNSTAAPTDIGYGFVTTAPFKPALPQTLFGSLKTTIGGWGLDLKASKNEGKPTGISLGGTSVGGDTKVRVAADTDAGLKTVSVSRTAPVGNSSSVLVQPTLVVGGDSDVMVDYDNDATGTCVNLKASLKAQKLVVKQDVGDATRVSVTASTTGTAGKVVVDHTVGPTDTGLVVSADTGGDVTARVSQPLGDSHTVGTTLSKSGGLGSVVWNRDLGGKNKVTTTYAHGESVDVVWKDSGWTTRFHAPIVNGTVIEGVSVSTKKKVDF